ncbi:MAG: hydantoinase/oxoprolinase family protein, partial [Armatimonadia bacterium]
MARDLGWQYERVCGDPHLLRKMLSGDWDEAEFLVLQPGQRSATSGDEGLLAAVNMEQRPATPPTRTSETSTVVRAASSREGCAHGAGLPARRAMAPQPVIIESDEQSPLPASLGTLGLGIDAGGTYTDCVLYDLTNRCVISKAKAITTHHNLSVGIAEGLSKLVLPENTRVTLVALSTTLATNSIVEGKGGRPGAIIMSPISLRPGDLKWHTLRHVSGAMSIRGEELEPPNREEIEAAVRSLLADGVDAFAVSGYASVRNPEHELLVRDVIRQHCDFPVVCGHELSMRLDYLARANTAILNARLLSVIGNLLQAVKTSLAEIGVQAPLMVVKGVGSLINEQTARERPVETILSGPAASVSGARHLTDITEGLVFDMGGTTTDSALLSQGLPRIHPEGATVGGWRTSVEAADIATIGLGGDSHITFNADRELLVGPRRVLPVCYLAAEAPQIKDVLRRMDPNLITNRGNSQVLEFFRLGRDHEDTPLDDRSLRIIEALQDGPLSREQLGRKI